MFLLSAPIVVKTAKNEPKRGLARSLFFNIL